MADGFDDNQISPIEQTSTVSVESEAPETDSGFMGKTFGGRPVMVYLVLFAGTATLLALLGVVWMSATGGGSDERPICTTISSAEARDAILGGQVARIDVLVDRDRPLQSLTGVVLTFNDGTCHQSAQGADFRNDLYMVLGVTEHFNNFADSKVHIHYQQQQVEADLLATSTPTPTPTEEIPPTVESTATIAATATPTATIQPTATAAPPTATIAKPTVAPPTATRTDVIAAPTEAVTISPTNAP